MKATKETGVPSSASKRAAATKLQMSVLAQALHALPPSGEAGFGDLAYAFQTWESSFRPDVRSYRMVKADV